MSNSIRCAACKYLRRKCRKDCIFAPYFPSNDLQRFSCVHKIFGASNAAKMLEQLPQARRAEAAECMVLEATARVRDPVYGSVGMISQLQQHIREAEYELAKTQGLIALCVAQCDHQNNLTLLNNTLMEELNNHSAFNPYLSYFLTN